MKNEKFIKMTPEEQCKEEIRLLIEAKKLMNGVPLRLDIKDKDGYATSIRLLKFTGVSSDGELCFQMIEGITKND